MQIKPIDNQSNKWKDWKYFHFIIQFFPKIRFFGNYTTVKVALSEMELLRCDVITKDNVKTLQNGRNTKLVNVTRLIERCNTERRGKHFRSLDVNNMQITNDNTWKLCIWFVLENIEKTTRLKSTTQITKKSIQKPNKRRKWYRGPLMRCEMFPLSKLYLWD